VIALVALGVVPASARGIVPLPKPRPAEAPAAPTARDADAASQPDEADAAEADAKAKPAPKPQSACRQALAEAVAIAPSIPDITGPGACGGPDLVRLEAVVLPDGSRATVSPAAILRCPMARAIVDWIRSDVAPLATSLGSRVADLDNFDSYECRGRNRVRGAKLSEHGRANALDVRGVKLANGTKISLTDREVPRAVRERVLQSVCARFTTVLGPGSDGYHEDHVHIDLAERRQGYKMCQWEVYEPLPAIAPLLPAERPAEAPPREVAAGEESAPQQARPAQPETSEPAERDEAEAPPSPPSKPAKRAKPKAATGKPGEGKPPKPEAARRPAAMTGDPTPVKPRRGDQRS
jgi:hypothetical protein